MKKKRSVKFTYNTILKIVLTVLFLSFNFLIMLLSKNNFYLFFPISKWIYLLIYLIFVVLNLKPFLFYKNNFLDISLYFYYSAHILALFFSYIVLCLPICVLFIVASNICLILNFLKYKKYNYKYPYLFLPLLILELLYFIYFYLTFITY